MQTNAQGAYVSKILNNSKNGGVDVAITVTSNDLKKANMYNLHIEGATTGINKPQTVTLPNGINAIYLKTFVTRTVTFPGLVNGINKPQTVTLPNGINAIYNLAGQQVSSMTSGNVYIVKTTDGKTKKVIKK